MENLCTEILEIILFGIPVDAAIQAKRVCTTWRAIIRNKTEKPGGFLFAHSVSYRVIKQLLFYEDDSKLMNYFSDNMETENSRFITESVPKNFMVGSCNGLVCFGKYYAYSPHPFLVCNPFKGESVCLPEFNYSEVPGARHISSTRKPYGRLVSGFGYCPSTNDYKVVSILYCKEEREGGHVHVYTLGTGKWRYIGFTGHRCVFSYLSGIYANGALFWLHQSSNYRVRRVHESEIAAFDLEGEKFHYIALPRCEDFEYITDYNSPLKLLGGNNNLYLAHAYNGGCRTDIWVYNRNKILPHWHKEFSIKPGFPFCSQPIAITRSNAVLWYRISGMSLYWYDTKTSTLNEVRDDNKAKGGERVHIDAKPHTRSIVSLKDLGEIEITRPVRFRNTCSSFRAF